MKFVPNTRYNDKEKQIKLFIAIARVLGVVEANKIVHDIIILHFDKAPFSSSNEETMTDQC